jgi:hypothetical protein
VIVAPGVVGVTTGGIPLETAPKQFDNTPISSGGLVKLKKPAWAFIVFADNKITEITAKIRGRCKNRFCINKSFYRYLYRRARDK